MLNKKNSLQNQGSFLNKSSSFVVEVIKVVVISLAIIIPIRYFLMQPFYVKGASMEPNFYDYEYLIIDEISYRFHNPTRGEVVVLEDPRNPTRFFIKRVIGLPGEEVVIEGGQVTIVNNEYSEGVILNEIEYLPEDVKTSGNIDIILGEDEFYVLGDNRPASLDSRIIGPITKDEIIGRTWLRAWPFNKLTRFIPPIYNL